jgi:hypothetical protein
MTPGGILKNKPFLKWQKKQLITDKCLLKAASEIRAGLYDAKLNGIVYKKRIQVPGRGKRSGARTLLAYKCGTHIFFLHGFLKNEKENISHEDLTGLEKLAEHYLGMTDSSIKKALDLGILMEINDET